MVASPEEEKKRIRELGIWRMESTKRKPRSGSKNGPHQSSTGATHRTCKVGYLPPAAIASGGGGGERPELRRLRRREDGAGVPSVEETGEGIRLRREKGSDINEPVF